MYWLTTLSRHANIEANIVARNWRPILISCKEWTRMSWIPWKHVMKLTKSSDFPIDSTTRKYTKHSFNRTLNSRYSATILSSDCCRPRQQCYLMARSLKPQSRNHGPDPEKGLLIGRKKLLLLCSNRQSCQGKGNVHAVKKLGGGTGQMGTSCSASIMPRQTFSGPWYGIQMLASTSTNEGWKCLDSWVSKN